MSKITSFDRSTCDIARKALEDALSSLEKTHGIVVKLGPARFNTTYMRFPKMEVAVVGHNGEVHSREAEAFKAYSHIFGVEAAYLNATITANGKIFKLIGLNSRSRKAPFIGETPDGKTWNLPKQLVINAIAAGTAQLVNRLPDVGDTVLAQWSDGGWYPAKYLRPIQGGKFRVKFEDGSLDTVTSIKPSK